MKNVLKYQLWDLKWSILVYYLVFIILTLFGNISLVSINTKSVSTSFGSELASAIVCFVIGICLFKEHYWMLAQNGVSRKTFFKGTLATMEIVSVGMAVIHQIILVISQSVLTKSINRSLLQTFYPQYGGSLLIEYATNILFIACIILLAFVAGFLIAAAFYRVNKAAKILIAAGLPILIFVILPITYLPLEPFWKKVFDIAFILVGGQAGNPLYAVGITLVSTAVLTGINYLIVRKAQI